MSALAQPKFSEGESDFEKEFGILSNPDAEKDEAKRLKQMEDFINKENQRFKNGKATFTEKLYPESNLPIEEFEKEKEGLFTRDDLSEFKGDRINGVFLPPLSERTDPENEAKLAAFYDRSDSPSAVDNDAAGRLGLF